MKWRRQNNKHLQKCLLIYRIILMHNVINNHWNLILFKDYCFFIQKDF